MTGALLAFDGVTCLRGDRMLFEAMTFALAPGDAAVFTGPNGVGKSSLLRIAAGLLPPTVGTVRRKGGIAWLGEQAALDMRKPLRQALAYWAEIDNAHEDAVAAALATMDIAALADLPVRMLSSGQRRRAGLARVMLSNTTIWLLDEPGNGLDAASLARLAEALATHRANGGIVLAATHQPIDMPGAVEFTLETKP